VLPAEAAAWDRDLVETKQQIKDLEARKKQLENQLKAAIGNNTFGLLPCGERYKWGTYAKAAYTVQAMEVKPLLRCK
jgi:predicted phage-related endonuclease